MLLNIFHSRLDTPLVQRTPLALAIPLLQEVEVIPKRQVDIPLHQVHIPHQVGLDTQVCPWLDFCYILQWCKHLVFTLLVLKESRVKLNP